MSEDTFRLVVTVGVGIAALCILVMTATAIALAMTATKLKKKIDGVMDRVEPIIDTVSRLVKANEAKVSGIADRAADIAVSARDIVANAKIVSTHAMDIVVVVKDQAHIYAELGRDVADRARSHVARVDAVLDETVEKAQYASENAKVAVKEAVMRPVREANGIFAGVRAAAETLRRGRMPNADHVTQDEEMFI